MFNFGTHLKALRKSKNLTQKQLAVDIGASERGIQQYELGERKPTYDMLITLANYFDVPVDYLLGNGIYGQLQSVPKLKEVLATEIEKQLGADLLQSLLGGPLSAVDDVTFGKIADLLVEEIQICEDGSIVIQFKG